MIYHFNVPAPLVVLHGFNAVAELKEPRSEVGGQFHAKVLHGFNAVAELKGVGAAVAVVDHSDGVLHGFNAVAELKVHRRVVS